MLTICPDQLSLKDLIISYFNKYPEEAKELPIDQMVKTSIIRKVIAQRMAERYERVTLRRRDIEASNPFAECFDRDPRNNTKCDFLKVLYEYWDKGTSSSCFSVDHHAILIDFFAERILQGTRCVLECLSSNELLMRPKSNTSTM